MKPCWLSVAVCCAIFVVSGGGAFAGQVNSDPASEQPVSEEVVSDDAQVVPVEAELASRLRLVATSLSAGMQFTCALIDDGSVECWGSNTFNQLDPGEARNSRVPVQLHLNGDVKAIMSYWNGNCAVIDDEIRCDGHPGHRPLRLGGPIKTLDAGKSHACAVLASGELNCWQGQDRAVVPHGLLSGVTDVACGHDHTCAVVEGKAKCWGRNTLGQLGLGRVVPKITTHPLPQTVQGLPAPVMGIDSHNHHTCVYLSTGAAMCWGWNTSGQLGDGDHGLDQTAPVFSPTAVQVVGLESGVTSIATGEKHSCAIQDGKAKCWGHGRYGQLGDGTRNDSPLPVTVIGLDEEAVQIVAGHEHTCFLLKSGSVKCVGHNGMGQIGQGAGSAPVYDTPQTVIGF